MESFRVPNHGFVVHVPWAHVLKATVIPSISFNPDYRMALIAVLAVGWTATVPMAAAALGFLLSTRHQSLRH
jgi:hypothetical protein